MFILSYFLGLVSLSLVFWVFFSFLDCLKVWHSVPHLNLHCFPVGRLSLKFRKMLWATSFRRLSYLNPNPVRKLKLKVTKITIEYWYFADFQHVFFNWLTLHFALKPSRQNQVESQKNNAQMLFFWLAMAICRLGSFKLCSKSSPSLCYFIVVSNSTENDLMKMVNFILG